MKILSWLEVLNYLPTRDPQAHKGDFGHLLVIAGDQGMAGAARLAAEAALRVGSGVVTLATHPQHASFIAAVRPEIMVRGVSSIEELKPLLGRATAIVIGCGMQNSEWSEHLYTILPQCALPKVIDAGALDYLKVQKMDLSIAILTPHPGEAARLLNTTAAEVQKDRLATIQRLQSLYPATVVLKGHGSLIQSREQRWLCPYGNPGMASAGMGDLLSGIIGGLLAQGLSPENAACLGVYLHGHAGDLAAQQQGQRGLLALDLLPYVVKLLNNA